MNKTFKAFVEKANVYFWAINSNSKYHIIEESNRDVIHLNEEVNGAVIDTVMTTNSIINDYVMPAIIEMYHAAGGDAKYGELTSWTPPNSIIDIIRDNQEPIDYSREQAIEGKYAIFKTDDETIDEVFVVSDTSDADSVILNNAAGDTIIVSYDDIEPIPIDETIETVSKWRIKE